MHALPLASERFSLRETHPNNKGHGLSAKDSSPFPARSRVLACFGSYTFPTNLPGQPGETNPAETAEPQHGNHPTPKTKQNTFPDPTHPTPPLPPPPSPPGKTIRLEIAWLPRHVRQALLREAAQLLEAIGAARVLRPNAAERGELKTGATCFFFSGVRQNKGSPGISHAVGYVWFCCFVEEGCAVPFNSVERGAELVCWLTW